MFGLKSERKGLKTIFLVDRDDVNCKEAFFFFLPEILIGFDGWFLVSTLFSKRDF